MNDIQHAIEFFIKENEIMKKYGVDPECVQAYKTAISAMQELQQYKELEEQGRLMQLPCKVGDTLYRIDTDEKIENAEIEYLLIENIVICKSGDVLFKCDNYDGVICHLENIITDTLYLDFYKVFLTKEAAEKALEAMKNE